MNDSPQNVFQKNIVYLFICALMMLVVVSFIGQLYQAQSKPFWGDEEYGIETSVAYFSYGHMLLHGAQGQGSPAPLDYLALKIFDDMKIHVDTFGLSDEVYYRLWANGVTVVMCFIMALLLLGDINSSRSTISIKSIQMTLVVFACVTFLFSRMVYYYAAEARPYALWNVLWMFSLVVSLSEQKSKRLLIISLCLLAMSATASIFQILMMAIAFGIFEFLKEKKFQQTILKTMKIFVLPFLISFYYCLQADKWSIVEAGGTFHDFLDLWNHKATTIPLMGVAIGLCFIGRDNRKHALAPLSVLLLFLIGPLIFWVTRLKGFFYAERQFVYYDLTYAVFLLTVMKCLPSIFSRIKLNKLKMGVFALIFFIGFSMTFRKKLLRKVEKSTQATISFLKEPSHLNL